MNNEKINKTTAQKDQEKANNNSFDGFLQILQKPYTISMQGWVYGLIAILAVILILD